MGVASYLKCGRSDGDARYAVAEELYRGSMICGRTIASKGEYNDGR